jgi:hypothetical protein
MPAHHITTYPNRGELMRPALGRGSSNSRCSAAWVAAISAWNCSRSSWLGLGGRADRRATLRATHTEHAACELEPVLAKSPLLGERLAMAAKSRLELNTRLPPRRSSTASASARSMPAQPATTKRYETSRGPELTPVAG